MTSSHFAALSPAGFGTGPGLPDIKGKIPEQLAKTNEIWIFGEDSAVAFAQQLINEALDNKEQKQRNR